MPFVSNAQRQACYAKKKAGTAGSWNCNEWQRATGGKKLPEHSKKASEWEYLIPSFTKLAKRVFDPDKYPVVSPIKLEDRDTQPSVQDAIVKRIKKAVQQQKSSATQQAEKTASVKWNLNTSVALWNYNPTVTDGV